MQLTFKPARLTGFAILAVAGATALSVGACSSSRTMRSHPLVVTGGRQRQQDVVHGLVASVSGNAVQVTETTGTATVDVSPSAKITENTKAQLTDVAAGNCVRVVPTRRPGPRWRCHGQIRGHVSPPAGDGKCPQPKTAAARTPGAPPTRARLLLWRATSST